MKRILTAIGALTALSLAACSPAETGAKPKPNDLGQVFERQCDIQAGDMKAAQEALQVASPACKTDAACTLVPGICGEPVAVHTRDAACHRAAWAELGSVVDCEQPMITGNERAVCEREKCVVKGGA